jgi:hypothetical protein
VTASRTALTSFRPIRSRMPSVKRLHRNKCFRLHPAPLADGLQSQLR